VDTFPRWSERFIARELNELVRRGVELTIFAFRRGPAPDAPDPEFSALLGRVALLPRVAVATALKQMRRSLAGKLRPEAQSVHRALGAAGLVRAARADSLATMLRRHSCAHIHAHFANWPSTVAWLAATELGLPFSFSAHAQDLYAEAQLLEEKTSAATAVFVCHQHGFRQLSSRVSSRQKVQLMYHGLPLEEFPFQPPSARPPRAGGRPALLFAGRLVEKKGVLSLLMALAEPALARRNVQLTIVGDGPERAELRRQISNRRLRRLVELVPPDNLPALRARLAAADLLVVPSQEGPSGDRDGIPNIVLEAFALGTPVVGTTCGGLPEVLTPETAQVVEVNYPPDLAEAIAAALGDPRAADGKARAARALVEARHDIRTAIRPLLEKIVTDTVFP
jgi:glycosyltransferase involved in cell wall biosynthesis